jgi:hypothetical protein
MSTALQSSSKSFKSELSNLHSAQREKFKKIDEELRAIKQRLRSKQLKMKEPCKEGEDRPNVMESDRYERNRLEELRRNEKEKKFRDSIQQNINCINIYNNSNNNTPRPLNGSSKRLTQQPVISFTISPPQKDKKTKETAHNLVLEQHGFFFDSPLEDIEDQLSFDTYDIELNIREEAGVEPPKFSNLLKLDQADR